ncbi:hypothetical protein [Clostridium perfringens]|uniref:hypothetical protein n=1 Tax=Clostridium perfringens TaxID=1502 RepID=UPI00096AB713|nr:hypothetical protein [Clostridium perfringens]
MIYCRFRVSGSDGEITSGVFIIRIKGIPDSSEAIQGKDEIYALKEVEKYVTQAKVDLKKFEILQDQMLETDSIISENEKKYKK